MLRTLLQRRLVVNGLSVLASAHPSTATGMVSSVALHSAMRHRSSPFDGTVAEFQSVVSTAPTLVNFYTTWCDPCKKIAPEYEQLSGSHPAVTFLNVNVEACEEVSALHDIRSIPTFLAFKEGQLFGRVEGGQLDDIRRLLQDLVDPSKLPREPEEDPHE